MKIDDGSTTVLSDGFRRDVLLFLDLFSPIFHKPSTPSHPRSTDSPLHLWTPR